MNVAVNSERPERCMVQVLYENPCYKIAQTDVRCLQCFDEKTLRCNL